MMRNCALILLSLFCLFSCSRQKETCDFGESKTEYASLLKIYDIEEGITLCQIDNPWEKGKLLAQYLLIPKTHTNPDNKKLEEKYGESQIIRIPLERMCITNSCHAYLFSQLNAISNIAVICEAEYVANIDVKEQIENGRIANGGNSMTPNIETIISLNCDAMLSTPFQSSASSTTLHLPTEILPIACADYMETTPLGRAEWMKFYGALANKEHEADSLFNIVKDNYNNLKNSVPQNHPTPPLLLAETPYQGTWFVPGGSSTMGILYKDAGYNYPWEDDLHSGSIALSQEAVLEKASNADVWVIKYYSDHDYTLEEFVVQNPFFSQFGAAKTGNVFGCNTQSNDYFDVMPFRPDILLSEIKNLGQNLGQCYFKKLD